MDARDRHHDARYAALVARDRRFDGVFFVGVSTTGVYCRPICPARTPGRTRCQFYDTAAAAERAGYRACFRCRPEIAPGAASASPASVDAVATLAAAVAHRVAEGAIGDRDLGRDDDRTPLAALAAELGVSERHVRRATHAHFGVSPIELAQTHRLALAKQLLHDTRLPITDIAFASGFRSVRRFNAAFASVLGRPPTAVRRALAGAAADAGTRDATPAIALRLDYRAPYDAPRVLAFLRTRAIPGVEVVDDASYRRVVHLAGATGEICAMFPPPKRAAIGHVRLELSASLLPVAMPLVARVRRLFDLDARPDRIAGVLRRDPALAPLVRARPGLRVPGAVDPFEAAVRAMVGQQISVAAARTLAGRFAAAFGAPFASDHGLTTRFPTAADVADAGAARIAAIGLPSARARALAEFARAIASGAIDLVTPRPLDDAVAQLVELPGIGPWTAHYLAMRALHLPDAFPAADLGVRKALAGASPAAATARAEAWRPYRSYAVIHLWTSLGETT